MGSDPQDYVSRLKYDTADNLIGALEPAVIRPAVEMADRLLHLCWPTRYSTYVPVSRASRTVA